jgi:glycosyltransferase involved in cell wall biosynthesis
MHVQFTCKWDQVFGIISLLRLDGRSKWSEFTSAGKVIESMEPPWILVLCHEFPPLGGGAGKNLSLLCRELTQLGVMVKVWTVDPGVKKRRPYNFNVHYFNIGRKERFETSLKGMVYYIGRTILHGRTLRKSKPVLIFSVLGIPAGIAGTLLSSITRIPHWVWFHGSDIHAGRLPGPGPLHRLLLGRIWKRSEANFFVSKGLQAMAQGLGKPKNSSLLSSCPAPEILAYPVSGGATGGKRYFLFLGRFDPVKNPMLPIQAMFQLKAKAKVTYKLRMVGSGVLGPQLHQFVRMQALSGVVALEPAAKFSLVPELLRSAYALILPSRMEGFNTTLLEAAHFGVPAIASDTHGIREFVVHGETGLLFEENNAQALANAMETLAANPELRDQLGQKAKLAALPFKPKAVAQTFLKSLSTIPGMPQLTQLQGA